MWPELFKVNGILAAWLRQRKFALPIFVAKHSARFGITPNVYTVVGLVLCGAASVFVGRGQLRLAGVLWLFGGICDVMDGQLARQTGTCSIRGAFLDSLIDHCADSALFVGFILLLWQRGGQSAVVISFIALATSMISSHIRSRAEMFGVKCQIGLATRTERVVILVVALLSRQVVYGLMLLVIVNGVTCIQRFASSWRSMGILLASDRRGLAETGIKG
jgi:CDP-diacylglycerol---glycerol-3-phosphate 3-phosphatidyltransferase